tara:strand:- start:43 stop:498 length:456 start_codon:yes stop_codon:yes gene_type:complete
MACKYKKQLIEVQFELKKQKERADMYENELKIMKGKEQEILNVLNRQYPDREYPDRESKESVEESKKKKIEKKKIEKKKIEKKKIEKKDELELEIVSDTSDDDEEEFVFNQFKYKGIIYHLEDGDLYNFPTVNGELRQIGTLNEDGTVEKL